MKTRALFVAGAWLAALCAPGHAQTMIPFGPSLEGSGWKSLSFRGLKPAVFTPNGPAQLDVVAERAASLIWRELPEEASGARGASWRWRVQSGPPGTDLTRRGEDDRAIAIYFAFARDEQAARWARGASSLNSAMWWSSGRALVYVFGGASPRGAFLDSPHLGSSGKLIVRQPGGVAGGPWLAESVDLAADFRRAFGQSPGPLVGIAISSDSDDTGARTVAAIGDLVVR